MADPFVAEIRVFSFTFPPRGWATCDGQILPLSQNTALFSLLGTTYGGNGSSNFALPNLQGLAARGFGQGPGLSEVFLGETGGSESVTLLQSELPAHAHGLRAENAPATENDPQGNRFAQLTTPGLGAWGSGTAGPVGGPNGVSGGGLPHNNLQPSLVLNFCIALQGVFPPRQ